MFPEELGTFALANPKYLKAFKIHHADLLTASYWKQSQKNVADGVYEDVYPYPDKFRFCEMKKATK